MRTLRKSCCGSTAAVVDVEKPLSKDLLSFFQKAGYRTSEYNTKNGIFLVEKNGLTATASFGSKKLQVNCKGSANCNQMIDGLENTIKAHENS
jgi:hypothetical protein